MDGVPRLSPYEQAPAPFDSEQVVEKMDGWMDGYHSCSLTQGSTMALSHV